jgi:hypothetical protein
MASAKAKNDTRLSPLKIVENEALRDFRSESAYSERSRTRFRLIANSVPIHAEQHSD